MNTGEKYYVMAAENPNRMLLYSMPQLPNDLVNDWGFGKPFTEEPQVPIQVEIQAGFEHKELLPFFDDPPLVSQAFLKALQDAGVDNVVAYEAEICSQDGSIVHKGYKAINIIGVIKAADLGTVFTGETRLIDASINSLEIDEVGANGALMFRLAESTSAIIVHDRVKKVIESRNFNSVIFRKPEDYLSP